MTRWEYLSLAVVDGKPHTQNGHRADPQWTDTNAFDYFNYLGAQGWEMIATSEIKGDNTIWFYFKRPSKPAS